MTAEQILSETIRLELGGDVLAAYDVVAQGLSAFPDNVGLRHRAVLLLARGGATSRAYSEYERLGLRHVRDHVDVIALGARLHKDLALARAGEERKRLAQESADMYAAAYALHHDYYPGINTAAMLLIAGDAARARAVATEVLDSLAAGSGEGAEDAYYRAASRAEAFFILGRIDEAEQALANALACDPANYAAHASTLRQLDAICATLKLDSGWLERHSPPPALTYCGHMFDEATLASAARDKLMADISAVLDHLRPCAVFGALAAGADIIVAEAALARGAELHVVLPMQEDAFLTLSVAPFGAAWIGRYEACKARAATFRLASQDTTAGDDAAFAFCSEYAMGLAIRHAEVLRTRAWQLAVWDGKAGEGAAGTAADVRRWSSAGRPQAVVAFPPRTSSNGTQRADDESATGRRLKAMLFGDVRGFSRLREADISAFVARIMAPLAEALRDLDVPPDLVATWGDGIHAVYPSVATAAEAALALQHAFARIDLGAAGLPPHLALRLGGHFGPVTELDDPFLNARSFYGTHITIAARIEPVAVPGTVYVSEPFAALLALEAPGRFSTDYVGQTELPKQFGTMRLFALRRATPA
ncbi:MAG: adenylate cyclase [Proteobacteria bacterium]|nr:adenylate cyclase [Pseudomonadota bacterium]